MRKIDTIAVHCSATPVTMDIGADKIREWHLARGWSDIGYHFIIKRDGSVDKGRSIDRVGAHVSGHNTGSIGVCLIGGINKAGKSEANFTLKQYVKLKQIVDELKLNYPAINHVKGHKDFEGVAKDCPCFNVAELLKD